MRDSKSLNPGFRDTFLCALCGAEREFLSILDAFSWLNSAFDKILNDTSGGYTPLGYIAFQARFPGAERS